MSNCQPLHETFMWQPVVDGRKRDIPLDVQLHPAAYDGDDNLLMLYAGMGEERQTARLGVRQYDQLGLRAIAPVIAFHHLPAEPVNIERTAIEAPLAVAAHYNQRAGRNAGSPVDAIGRSQGGGVAICAASRAPQQYGALGLHFPAGLTNHALGGSVETREKELVARLGIRNTFMNDKMPFLDPSTMTAWFEGGRRACTDLLGRLATVKLRYAVSQDLGPSLQKITVSNPVRLFAGQTDPVFRHEEYAEALERLGIGHIMTIVPGSHAFLGSRACQRQNTYIAEWLHGQRQPQNGPPTGDGFEDLAA